MNTKIFEQGSGEWASYPYPNGDTVKSNGCGLLAITNVAIEIGKYWDKTPAYFYPYMLQYAVYDNGTKRQGIEDALDKYFGNHITHNVSSSMKFVWEALGKGNTIAIILFGAGTAYDGTEWTLSGHFVAVTGYEYKDGKHWLYTKDSSWRHNDGWHSYEDSMQGLIPENVYTAVIPAGKWIKKGGYWYYYEGDTMVKNAWKQDTKGDWYYLGKDGKMVVNAWAEDGGKWYWLGKDGKMVKSNLIEWKGNKYYLQSSGVMASSKWIKFKVGWRYFAKSGKMLRNRWFRYKGDDYYFNSAGVMVTGKRNIPCNFGTDGKLKGVK